MSLSTPRWFIIHLQQEGRLKRLPRMMIVDTMSLTVGAFIQQLHSLCTVIEKD